MGYDVTMKMFSQSPESVSRHLVSCPGLNCVFSADPASTSSSSYIRCEPISLRGLRSIGDRNLEDAVNPQFVP